MTTPQQIREWLIKMEYPNVDTTDDESLQILCRGAMGPIFQQIIDRVKPRQDVEHVRKAILTHTLQDKDKYITKRNQDDIEKLRLYNERKKLQKELNEINRSNNEKKIHLQLLITKVKSKNAKYQLLKRKLYDSEQNIALCNVKTATLDKELKICENIAEQSTVLESIEHSDKNSLPNKISQTITQLSDIISSYNRELCPPNLDLPTISENSSAWHLQTSDIINSIKKPFSARKRTRANSTRENLHDITNNLLLKPSTARKTNISPISFSSITSTSNNLSTINKNVEVMKDLEQICWNEQSVKQSVEEIWKFDRNNVFKILLELKEKQKNKIVELVIKNENRSNDYSSKIKSVRGLEKLYAYHLQTNMKRLICVQEQKTIKHMLNNYKLNDSTNNIQILQSAEFSLQNKKSHLRNCILNLQKELPDNSEKLEQILMEIQNVQTQMSLVKSKIGRFLCLLSECASWMIKHEKNISESIKKSQFYSDFKILNLSSVEKDVNEYLSHPVEDQDRHYFDNWLQIYNSPKLLEIFQCPFLSPENAIKFEIDKRNWLLQLQSLENQVSSEKLIEKLTLVNVADHEKQMNIGCKKSIEKLKSVSNDCSEMSTNFINFNSELKYYSESNFDEFVLPNVKYEEKTLKEYCEIYDNYYRRLK